MIYGTASLVVRAKDWGPLTSCWCREMIMLEVDGQEVTSISRRNAVTVAYCHTAPVVTAATRHSLVCSTICSFGLQLYLSSSGQSA